LFRRVAFDDQEFETGKHNMTTTFNATALPSTTANSLITAQVQNTVSSYASSSNHLELARIETEVAAPDRPVIIKLPFDSTVEPDRPREVHVVPAAERDDGGQNIGKTDIPDRRDGAVYCAIAREPASLRFRDNPSERPVSLVLDDLVERDSARPVHSERITVIADSTAVAGLQRRPVEVKSADDSDDKYDDGSDEPASEGSCLVLVLYYCGLWLERVVVAHTSFSLRQSSFCPAQVQRSLITAPSITEER
jgi:hypothetical protein